MLQHIMSQGIYCRRRQYMPTFTAHIVTGDNICHELRRRSHHALAHFASHRCDPSSIPGLGRARMCEKFHQLLAVGPWFPPGTPVSSTRKLISSSSFHRLDMTLAVAEALSPNKPYLTTIRLDRLYRVEKF